MTKYQEFSIESQVSREKALRSLSMRSPKAAAKVLKRLQGYQNLHTKLKTFCQTTPQLQSVVEPVVVALSQVIDNQEFQPDRRDKEILKAGQKLIISYDIYEDIKIRYNADCKQLTSILEQRSYAPLTFKNSEYKLTKQEKKEKLARQKEQKLALDIVVAQEAISQYRQEIVQTNAKITQKKAAIAQLDDQKAVLVLREIKVLESFIRQRENLIGLNERLEQSLQNEKFMNDKEKLLSKMDTKQQIKIIERAQKLYKQERVLDKLYEYQQQGVDKLAKTSVSEQELSELKKLRSVAQSLHSAQDKAQKIRQAQADTLQQMEQIEQDKEQDLLA